MKKFWSVTISLAVLGALPVPGIAQAAETSTAALIQRLDDLEQEVALLKRQLEVQKEIEDKKAAENPVITANAANGFTIKSPDDAFKFRARGYLQADARLFTDNDKTAYAAGTTDTFLLRRVRPSFEGTVFGKYDYVIAPSFDSGTASLQDAYLEYRYLPELRLRAGKFKAPFGLERLQSSAATTFIETAYPTSLTPNYDTGFQVAGDVWDGVVSYAVALANGTSDGASTDVDINSDKEIAARLIVSPFKTTNNEVLRGLSAGAAVTYGHKEGASQPTLRSPGQASIFTYNAAAFSDGPHTRFSPQLSWYYGPFGLLTEYVSSNQELIRGAVQDKFENSAWQTTVSYVLTGEDATYRGVVSPLKPFDPDAGTWGAWEIAGRYHELDIDDAIFAYPNNTFSNIDSAVTEAESWGLGLNWYLNRNVKWQLNLEHTEFSGGAPRDTLVNRPDENLVLSRFQISY